MEVTKVYDPYFGTTTSATHIVALEIDRETYKVKLNRYVVAAMRPSDQRGNSRRIVNAHYVRLRRYES